MTESSGASLSPVAAPRKTPRRWLRALLTLICLGLLTMWIYAFFFASKEAVGRLDDRAWTERAESICVTANEQRDELADSRRIDEAGPDALTERAAIVDEATDIVEQMLDDVTKARPSGPDDPALVARWEEFYRALIEDRRAYADVLRAGENEPFRETAEEGAPISEWINDFVVVNEMTSCAAPLDLSI